MSIIKSFSLVLITCSMYYSGMALAELYSWTDDEGVKHFTTSPPPKETVNVTVTPITSPAPERPLVRKAQKPQEKPVAITKTTEKTEASTPEKTALTKEEEDKIDAEIQAVWQQHWKHLENGDIEAALKHYTPDARKRYRPVLKALYERNKK